jgi:hypothetical protein
MNPPKIYAAEYKAPSIDIGLLGGDQTQQTQRPTSLLAG